MRRKGLSSAAVSLMEDAHRASTQSVYKCHWRRWSQYCRDKGLDPLSSSRTQLANHLAYLGVEKRLSASALRVRFASVNTTRRQLGLDPIPGTFSSCIIRAIENRAAKNPFRPPAWDLFLVLAYLRSSEFEPLEDASLVNLTRKTLFLVAVASAKRASELHALSGLPQDIRFSRGSVSLRFITGFLLKNQRPGDPSPGVSFQSLASAGLDGDDLLNCPVRALQIYLRRTQPFRGSRVRLFLSTNVAYGKDIVKSTIARWVAVVIRRAYFWAAQNKRGGVAPNFPCMAARAHEARAWATTLAVKHTVDMGAVMDAAYWRSPDVFIDHYLRDLSSIRQDGVYSLTPCVAARQVLSKQSC